MSYWCSELFIENTLIQLAFGASKDKTIQFVRLLKF
jgi:hypothetical protein